MITPAQRNAIADAALAFGSARARAFIDPRLPAQEQRELDRAADKAWSDLLAMLAAVTDWSANERTKP